MTASATRDHEHPACAAYEGLMARAADGLIDAGDQARLDAHLTTCAHCREALEAQRAMHRMVQASFDMEGAADLSTRIAAQFEPAESWIDRLDFRRWTWRISPVAAGLALGAWLVVSSGQTATALESTTTVETEAASANGVSWDEAVTDGDLVSLIWETEMAGGTAVSEERAQ